MGSPRFSIKMKSLEVFSTFLASAAARTHIKKSIIDNRIKFDQEVLFHGDAEFWEDYDDWDPYTDLDTEEIEDIMRRIAAHMDANKDGYVDLEELTIWTLFSMHNINAKWAHEEWEDIDMHGNNMGMSWQDVCNEEYGFQFEQSVDQYGPREVEKFDPDNEEYYDFNRNYNRNRAKFESADRNTDGFLNRDEWLLYNNPFKVQEVKDSMLKKIMEKIDTDQDGAISLQEYLNDWKIRPSDANDDALEYDIDEFKDDLDRNGDSILEGDELIFWLDADLAGDANDEAEHLMDTCDGDQDGKLTAEEIVDHYDFLIDHEVMEHGDTLRDFYYHDEFRK